MKATFWLGESRRAFPSPVFAGRGGGFFVLRISRHQVPLILAWALSIHKSQGQTIQRVKVDLGRVFEKGQSYVALSRAATIEGLQVLRFDPKKVPLPLLLSAFVHVLPWLTSGLLAPMQVSAHPKVIEWNKSLECLTK